MTLKRILLAVTIVALPATQSSAVVLTFSDFASWEAAIGSPTLLEDFEGATSDISFGTGSTTSPNGDLQLSANANFSSNAIIDVLPLASAGGEINGNVIVSMRFLDGGAGANPQETVTVSLPPGVSAFAFEYKNYDNDDDATFLSFEGTNGQVVTDFDPGTNGTTQFFGVVDTDPSASISSFSFTGDPNSGSGFSAFNSFDDVRYTEFDSLTLRVNTVTGLMEIVNDSGTDFDIDYYRIESTDDSLEFSNWNSFSFQELDAIDGADVGSTVGDGIGETWDEAGGSDDGVLSEAFLFGSSLFDNGRAESLGNAFDTGGDPNSLIFEFRRASDGEVFTGFLEFVSTGPNADFDGSGTVDALDFLAWQRGFGLTSQTDNSNGDANGDGTVDQLDLSVWQSQFGTTTLTPSSANVPEPSTAGLTLLAACSVLLRRRHA